MIRAIVEDSATDRLERMYDNWDATTIRGANHLAEVFAESMKSHILRGDFNVQKKNPSWVSYDSRPFINTGAYVKSIRSIGPGVVCDEQIKNWLEYGTRNQPPRPHWEPLLRQFARHEIPSQGKQIMYELSRY